MSEHHTNATGPTPWIVHARRKGARGEREFIQSYLAPHWPGACRNLDQYVDKRDVVKCAGLHWEIKRVERLNVWAAFEQASSTAAPADTPIVAFRRNRSPWLCLLTADDLLPLLTQQHRTQTHTEAPHTPFQDSP